MSEDRARIEAYLRWRKEATSTRIERSRFGTALFNDDFPSYWDGNFLRVEVPADTGSSTWCGGAMATGSLPWRRDAPSTRSIRCCSTPTSRATAA